MVVVFVVGEEMREDEMRKVQGGRVRSLNEGGKKVDG